ncbi:MAG: hypothetical protein GH156_02145 [Dehalococcoidia bacterium]|nr:hypothetical protein [Dehalococcoidia bacterium]
MEIKQDEVTQEQWEEMKKIVRENICAVCEGELTIHTNPENGTIEVGCLNRDHHGYIERETYTQAMRRGAEVHPAIRDAIERKMVPKDDLGRAMNLLALRYPSAIVDAPTAALFIMDCARLDLDPLIQPAEAVPIPFKSKKIVDGKEVTVVTISMIITEDGWLSMPARGCKEEWNGPPRTMRLEEYLTTLKENEGKTVEEIEAIARKIKKSACKDEAAWYYMAIGRSKTMTEDAVIPGWFTKRDMEKAEKGHLPAFFEPGNQARVRSIKKWVRHVYPECRQKMMDITAEWYQRAEGIKAAQEYIDAEYALIRPEGEEKSGEVSGDTLGEKLGEKVGAAAPAKARAQATKPVSTPAAEEKLPEEVTEEDIPDLNALCKACFHFWGMQPWEVWKELGYKSMIDVTESPWECWLKIKAVKTA